jgi:hypothetical protein
MRLPLVAAAILVFALMACGGPEKPTGKIRPEDTLIETPEQTESSPTRISPVPRNPDNTLVETPEYTGVIFSENRAREFSFLFDGSSYAFWKPSVEDVARAEACIRQVLVSVREDPDDYRSEHAAFILENLEQYRRQYVGIAVEGEKRIWVNTFFDDGLFPDWMREPVYVLDGGNHFWQIEYHLLEGECTDFYVHGEG